MTFKQVNEVPDIGRSARHDLKGMLKDFMESDKRIVKVELLEGDYKSALVARQCIATAVKRYKIPAKVHIRDDEVYLAKM